MSIYSVQAQPPSKKTVDSLVNLLAVADKGEKVNILVALSYLYSGDTRGKEYGTKALELATQLNNKEGLAKSHNSLGNYYLRQEDYAASIKSHKKALVIWQKLKSEKEIADTYWFLGNAYTDKSDFTSALKSYVEARKYFERTASEIKHANTLRKIGVIYSKLNEYDKALEYYQKAQKLYEFKGDKRGLSSTLNNIGVVYSNQNEQTKAWDYYKKARIIAVKNDDQFMISMTTGNMGEVLSAQKKYHEALPYYRKELKLLRELNIKNRQIEPLEYMAQAYSVLGKIDSAIYYGTKAYNLGTQIKEKFRLIEATKILSDIYQQKGSPDSALMYYKIYTQYKDSLFNRTRALELAEIEQKYDAEKYANGLKDQQKRRNFVITLGALFVVSGFAIFQWVFFSRQQKQKKQATENIELLSQIGKEITSSLNLEEISDKTYQHLNQLMDASIFGIGINIPEAEIVEFKLALKDGKKMKPYKRSLHYKDQLAVWCLQNKKTVFINDLEKDYHQYIARFDVQLESTLSKFEDGTAIPDQPQSTIYLPLLSDGEALGVVCVQSLKKNAYTDYHLNILENLAVYTAIALKNARAYEEKRQKNKQIEKHVKKFRQANKLIQEHYRELNRQKEHLEKTNIKLKQSQDSKARLTAMIAHDLKNPLNVIFAYSSESEAMKAEKPQVVKQIQDIHRSARRIKSYTNDMLEVQKYASSNLTLSKAQHRFHKIAQEALNYMTPFVEEKSIKVQNNIAEDLYGKFDAVYLERVFENLLTNAIKYTPIGGAITLSSEEKGDIVCIKVADTGQGIDPKDFENIFEAFNQVGNARDFANTGSTGLGLTFCKIALEAHGSQIKVASTLGEGTEFYFNLPKVVVNQPVDAVVEQKPVVKEVATPVEPSGDLTPEERVVVLSFVQSIADVPFYKRKKLEELVEQFQFDASQTGVQQWKEKVQDALRKRNKIRYQELIEEIKQSA
jgi:signal transduction histidine kinase